MGEGPFYTCVVYDWLVLHHVEGCAEALVSYEPLRRLAYLPYSKECEEEFLSIHMQHEDVMVGRVLVNELKYQPMVYRQDAALSF
ncbi:hypothetical protein TcBrA4_0032160 [Trypanosoma cruzi]|nr:hypothetical protein TcBrA4_0032160 [Trypanosoma cruzi]